MFRGLVIVSSLLISTAAFGASVTLTASSGAKVTADDNGKKSPHCVVLAGADDQTSAQLQEALKDFRVLTIPLAGEDGAVLKEQVQAGVQRLAKACPVNGEVPFSGVSVVGFGPASNVLLSAADDTVVNGVVIGPSSIGAGVKVTESISNWGQTRPMLILSASGDLSSSKIASYLEAKIGKPTLRLSEAGANDVQDVLRRPNTSSLLVSWINGTHELLFQERAMKDTMGAVTTEKVESEGTLLEE